MTNNMTSEIQTIEIDTTERKFLPGMFEMTGWIGDKRRVQVIAGRHGEALRAVFTTRDGNAFFGVRDGYHILYAHRPQNETEIEIWMAVGDARDIDEKNRTAKLDVRLIYSSALGTEGGIPTQLLAAENAVRERFATQDCRKALFVNTTPLIKVLRPAKHDAPRHPQKDDGVKKSSPNPKDEIPTGTFMAPASAEAAPKRARNSRAKKKATSKMATPREAEVTAPAEVGNESDQAA